MKFYYIFPEVYNKPRIYHLLQICKQIFDDMKTDEKEKNCLTREKLYSDFMLFRYFPGAALSLVWCGVAWCGVFVCLCVCLRVCVCVCVHVGVWCVGVCMWVCMGVWGCVHVGVGGCAWGCVWGWGCAWVCVWICYF